MAALNSNSSLLFVTFSPYVKGKRDPKNGNVDPFIDFFSRRIRKFVLLDQPHAGSNIVEPVVEEYQNGKSKKYILANSIYKLFYFILRRLRLTDDDTNILFKIRDIMSVLHVGFSSKEKFDFFVGLESINALSGFVLKLFGKVGCVIYYVSDYSPVRYNNIFFNSVYLALDRFCCYHADFIWDVSLAMQPGRIKAGLEEAKSAPVIHVPNALFPKNIKHLSDSQLIKNSLVFMGSLGLENGPDLAIKAMPEIRKKIPSARLHIIGGGKELSGLKELVNKLDLTEYIKFYGMIPKDEDMLAQLRKFSIALAPYKDIKNSVRMYGDSLKLRAYMASGIPVITTPVPPLGAELSNYGSAIITDDSSGSIAKVVIELLSSSTEYKKLRERAIVYGKSNTWNNSFLNAFEQMERSNY